MVQGAIFGGVKAAVDRAGAKAFTKATGKKLDSARARAEAAPASARAARISPPRA